MRDSQSASAALPAETALVVSLGKSHGASTVAAGLALVCATELGSEVLLAELDPAGGELVEKLFFQGRPTTASERSVPPGARELADRLSGLDLDFDPDSEATMIEEIELCSKFTVKLRGLDYLSVILGDPLVGVAARAASAVTPRLRRMASYEGFDVVVVDGGRWDSGQAARLVGVDVVYAVVEANSTSQLHRCVAEMQALWHELQGASSANRMVVVLTDLAWDAADVVDLFLAPPGTPARDVVPYRVVALESTSRKESRAVALIREGRWKNAADVRGGLRPFRSLASVLVDRSDGPELERSPDDSGEDGAPVDEFPYLSEESTDRRLAPPPESSEYHGEDDESTDLALPGPIESSGHLGQGVKSTDRYTSEVVEDFPEGLPLTPAADRAPSRDEGLVDGQPSGAEWPFPDFGSVAAAGDGDRQGSRGPHHPGEEASSDLSVGTEPTPPALPARTARSVEPQPAGNGEQAPAAAARRPPPPARPELAQRPGPLSSDGVDYCSEDDDPETIQLDHGEPSPAIQAALAAQPTVPPSRFRRREDS